MERSEYEVLAKTEHRHWWHGGRRALTRAMLEPLYQHRRDLAILDAGCGTGGNLHFLHRYTDQGGRLVGLDRERLALELAQPPHMGALLQGSVLALPFADHSFDLVTSFDVLYHRGVPDEVAALCEARRVLRHGGRILLRLPAYDGLRGKHDLAVHTRRRYRATDVQQMLAAAGFIVERWSYANTLLFPFALLQRTLEARPSEPPPATSDLTLPAAPINAALRVPFALEAVWLELGQGLPYGLSVLCLAHSGKLEEVTL
ncbi:MAG: class I SAM-dependent methyltransferase [Chloroflexaceae bacterium]|nr:class I SAM-dependent methyltransferase [Chloroflexaceae bacterium]